MTVENTKFTIDVVLTSGSAAAGVSARLAALTYVFGMPIPGDAL